MGLEKSLDGEPIKLFIDHEVSLSGPVLSILLIVAKPESARLPLH
jgi:hypothetical protein